MDQDRFGGRGTKIFAYNMKVSKINKVTANSYKYFNTGELYADNSNYLNNETINTCTSPKSSVVNF